MANINKTYEQLRTEVAELSTLVAQLRNSEALLKKAEASLKDEAIRRRMLVEQSTDGIVVLTIDGKVFEANQTYAEMHGYTLEEMQHLSIWDWQREFTHEQLIDIMHTVNESGDHFETTHTRKDGTRFDLEISTNGTICGGRKLIFCVCRDISERKKYEEQLCESKELLSTFIDNFRGIAYQIALCDIESFKPLLFRGAIEDVTGYENDEFTQSHTWNNLIHPEDRQWLYEVRTQFLNNISFVAETEYRIIRKDRSVRWVQDVAQIVKLGTSQVIHGTIFDITERKLAQENNIKLEERIRHSQKLEAIGTLAGGVAHDFNNILGIIMGYNDLALTEVPPASKIHDQLNHIRKASLRARDIIRQLLTFSRKVGTKKQTIDLSAIIQETVAFLGSTLPSTVELLFEPPQKKMMVLADPTQMHQVIMNLCVNASQSLENQIGAISIGIDTTGFRSSVCSPFKKIIDGMYIRVSICDSGSGIAPEILDRIFEPYFTTRETGKGSGMGLAVVHGIIENHGGAISVVSTPGIGTTFTFLLPSIDKADAEAPQPVQTAPVGNESVLFVDDEEEIVTIARLILEAQGFKVTAATDPLVALEMFRQNPTSFNIVITDMTMPHYNGDMLFKELQKINPTIPVVLCTGHSTHIDEERAASMGVAAFILKPLGKLELTKTIRDVLDRKS